MEFLYIVGFGGKDDGGRGGKIGVFAIAIVIE